MQYQSNLNEYIGQALKENWEQLSLTDFNGVSFQYKDVARKIAKLHILFREVGVEPGDTVALCGRNSSQWAVAFFAVVTYGAVAVPILNEFKPDNIHHLVNHSEAKLFFVSKYIWENLDVELMQNLVGVLELGDFSLLSSRSEKLTDIRSRLNEYFGR